MDDLGKWGKASANHPANVAKPLVDRIVEGIRDDKMASFLSGLQTGWGRRELHALTAPLPPLAAAFRWPSQPTCVPR